jgi:DNA-binding response OmpR family regulator
MSILQGKRVLVIGEEDAKIETLEQLLQQNGMDVKAAACGALSTDKVWFRDLDLIILNHLHEGRTCSKLLKSLQKIQMTKSLPVLSLVENVQDKINHALMMGAADYITPDESNDSVIQKTKVIFGEPDNFSSSTSVNISTKAPTQTTKAVKVFVIEDDSLLRNLLGTKFTLSNIQHEFSTDGLGVNDMIRAFAPQVIIFDIMIGSINGLDLLEQVKAEEDLASIPAIVFSNQDSDDERERAIELGAVRYFVKAATDLSDLVVTIQQLSTK